MVSVKPSKHRLCTMRNNGPCVIELLEPVLEDLLFLVLFDERVPPPQPVELVDHPLEELLCRHRDGSSEHEQHTTSQGGGRPDMTYRGHARMIGEHETAHSVVRLDIW